MHRPDKPDVVFTPLQPMIDHITAAENYVLSDTTSAKPYSDKQVCEALKEIDEAIRKEWAKLIRDEKTMSLGEAQE
eukprot:7659904-Karenia_brevis.AAC.1